MSDGNDNPKVLTYHGDDFESWNTSENNPDSLPVVQYQTAAHPPSPDLIGGWVLREPPTIGSGHWVQVPLQAQAEAAAIAEAKRLSAEFIVNSIIEFDILTLGKE